MNFSGCDVVAAGALAASRAPVSSYPPRPGCPAHAGSPRPLVCRLPGGGGLGLSLAGSITCLAFLKCSCHWDWPLAPSLLSPRPPETMSPALQPCHCPAALRGGQPLLLTSPCPPKPHSCRAARQGSEREGTHQAWQTTVLSSARLPAASPLPRPWGAPLCSSPCPPATTARNQNSLR